MSSQRNNAEEMTNAAAERQRVRALIERAEVAMLMNLDDRDTHVGRPMLPLFIQGDPHIFFLTHESSRKVMQLAARPQVGLTTPLASNRPDSVPKGPFERRSSDQRNLVSDIWYSIAVVW